MWKKRGLIIIVLLIFLLVPVFAIGQEGIEQEAFTFNPDKPQDFKDKVTKINPKVEVAPREDMKVTSENKLVDENSGSSLDLTNSEGNTNIRTEGSSLIVNEQGFTNTENIKVNKDDTLLADKVGVWQKGDDYGGQDITNFKFNQHTNEVTVSSGKNLHFSKPYPITFGIVKSAYFKLDNEGNLLQWRVQYPASGAFILKNPFASGLKPQDTTIPNALPTPYPIDLMSFSGLTGSAVSIPNISSGIDDFFLFKGDIDEFFSGNNEEYNGKTVGSKIEFSLTQSSDIQIVGSDKGKLWINATEGKAGIKFTVEFKDNGVYGGVTLNSTVMFNGNDYIENLQADITSFQLDIFEGFYSHNIFSSPGFYSFEFKDLPSFHHISFNNPLVRVDKNWAQNFKIERPEGHQHFNLFIDKFSRRASLSDFEADYSAQEGFGFVSLFNEHKVILNGIANYQRMSFNYMDSLIGISGNPGEQQFITLTHADGLWYPIIESLDPSNIVDLSLRGFNIWAEAVISYEEPASSQIFSAYFKDILIYEQPSKPISKRFMQWNSKPWPHVLQSLTVNNHPKLQAKQGTYFFTNNKGYNFTIYPEGVNYLEMPIGAQHPFVTSISKYMDNNHLCFAKLVPLYFTNRQGMAKTILDWFKSKKTLEEWQK